MITEIPPAVVTMVGSAGAAGSDEDRVILRDGSTIAVRPLATGDVAAIASWFEGLGRRRGMLASSAAWQYWISGHARSWPRSTTATTRP
jgi:hypothetical protein